MKTLLHYCLLAALTVGTTLSAYADAFTDGLSAYEKGEYTSAADHFQKAIEIEESAAAHHNLALSYFQLGQPAEAAWQIERALRIDPLKEEYYYKIGALRQQLGLFESQPEWYFIGAQLLSSRTWIIITCLSFWVLLAACLLPRINGSSTNLAINTARLLTVVTLLLAIPALWLNRQLDQSGIVISETATDLHAAPASAAPATGIARPGERARIVDTHNDFYQVETEGKATGWISKENFRTLALP